MQNKTKKHKKNHESQRIQPSQPVSVKKHSSGEEGCREDKLAEHQIRGWEAVSPSGLYGQGSHERIMFFIDTGVGSVGPLGLPPPRFLSGVFGAPWSAGGTSASLAMSIMSCSWEWLCLCEASGLLPCGRGPRKFAGGYSAEGGAVDGGCSGWRAQADRSRVA